MPDLERNVSAVSEARRRNSLELRGNAEGALSIQPFERSRGTKLWGLNGVGLLGGRETQGGTAAVGAANRNGKRDLSVDPPE